MMLRYWSKVIIISFVVLLSGAFTFAQSSYDSTSVIWVLIENNHQNTDSTNTPEHAKIMRQHMDYLSKIHSEQKMLASISFQGGGGLMFFKHNIDSIKSWMTKDPAIKGNLFKLSYLTWMPDKGNICQTDKNSKLGNVEVSFISFSSPKDPDMRERIKKKRDKMLSELKATGNTLCLGKMQENGSYAVISKVVPEMPEKTETSKTIGSGVAKDSHKAWAPLSAFCD